MPFIEKISQIQQKNTQPERVAHMTGRRIFTQKIVNSNTFGVIVHCGKHGQASNTKLNEDVVCYVQRKGSLLVITIRNMVWRTYLTAKTIAESEFINRINNNNGCGFEEVNRMGAFTLVEQHDLQALPVFTKNYQYVVGQLQSLFTRDWPLIHGNTSVLKRRCYSTVT